MTGLAIVGFAAYPATKATTAAAAHLPLSRRTAGRTPFIPSKHAQPPCEMDSRTRLPRGGLIRRYPSSRLGSKSADEGSKKAQTVLYMQRWREAGPSIDITHLASSVNFFGFLTLMALPQVVGCAQHLLGLRISGESGVVNSTSLRTHMHYHSPHHSTAAIGTQATKLVPSAPCRTMRIDLVSSLAPPCGAGGIRL